MTEARHSDLTAGADRSGAGRLPWLSEEAKLDVVRAFTQNWRLSLVALAIVTTGVIVGWRPYISGTWRGVWWALACANYSLQAWVYGRLESAGASHTAVRRWMPCVLASVCASSILWGAIPWMVPRSASTAVLFACVFNVMLFFCVASAPGTPSMLTCAAIPFALTTSLAPALRLEAPGVGAAGLGLFALIYVYGLRLQHAMFDAYCERRLARDLADQLRRQQAALVQSEQARAVLEERQRLMRDMHDGIGGALTAGLVAAERGGLQAGQMATMLRTCLDDLRMIIESLEAAEPDVGALLASLRYRLGGRLAAAGVSIKWMVGELPPLTWLGPSEALELLRIVQELLINTLKHANASTVSIEALGTPEGVRIVVRDNGSGFDTCAETRGRGLRFIQQRVNKLAGTILVQSEIGSGTCARLELPLTR